jgi:hypothetical protein
MSTKVKFAAIVIFLAALTVPEMSLAQQAECAPPSSTWHQTETTGIPDNASDSVVGLTRYCRPRTADAYGQW